MQDGFDKNVAEKMPKKLRSAPSRPWNVDPVLIRKSSDEEEFSVPPKKEPEKVISFAESPYKPEVAIDVIENLNLEVTEALFRTKDLERQARDGKKVLGKALNENTLLKKTISDLEKRIADEEVFKKEIVFLNEQAEDSSIHIENVSKMLFEKTQELESLLKEKETLEGKFHKLNDEIHQKAKFEVKSSILEKELGLNRGRVKELESLIDTQQEENESLTREIKELREALDKVYTSLSSIRVKAKKEAYGL